MDFDNDIIQTARLAFEKKRFVFTKHAVERMQTRGVYLEELIELFLSGDPFIERKKCIYDEKNKSWKYALRGDTIEDNTIRVVFSVTSHKKHKIIVITVIKLGK